MLFRQKRPHTPNCHLLIYFVFALQALQNPKNKEMDMLVSSLATLQQSTERTVTQWIPSHPNIPGNDKADRLTMDGGKLPQDLHEITFEEAQTIVIERQRRGWLQQQAGCILPPS